MLRPSVISTTQSSNNNVDGSIPIVGETGNKYDNAKKQIISVCVQSDLWDTVCGVTSYCDQVIYHLYEDEQSVGVADYCFAKQ
mmetsp:Transcript_3652/g.8358  ORF Transcript_3652/g.8358 Transcript_3652/m.8358 type:complete len:83 (+) Transcript_3652:127-375(+)